MTIVRPLALRILVLAVLTTILVVAWLSSDAASDPLGLGILVFLIYVVVAGLWGLVDGVRRSFGPALLVWLLVGVTVGLLIPLVTAAEGGTTDGLGKDLANSVPFFAVLIFVPAALAIGIGALIRKARD